MNSFGFVICLCFITLSAAQYGYRYNIPSGHAQYSVPSYVSSASSLSLNHVPNVYGPASSSPAQTQTVQTFAPVPPQQQQHQQQHQQHHQQQHQQVHYQVPSVRGTSGQASSSFQSIASAPQLNVNQLVGLASQAAQASSSSSSSQGAAGPEQVIVTKDIYIHSAPEETEETINTVLPKSGAAHKNYRIVFIKAPSPKITVSNAALSSALNEEKTVIYVLAKRPDLNIIQQQMAQHVQKANKPEVYFIKYQTPEEAQLAQREIQAQYDALGGTTSVSDEGIAPVHSVIGKSGGANAGSSAVSGSASSVSSGFEGGSASGATASVGSGLASGSGLSPRYSTVSAAVGGNGHDQPLVQSASNSFPTSAVSPTYLPAKDKKN